VGFNVPCEGAKEGAAMTTVRVVDPRLTVQELLEKLLTEQGYDIQGEPDLVLTTQRTTAWFWGRKGVPVVVYEKDQTIDVNDIMAKVGEALQAAAPSPPDSEMS
jgi:hypothetical protein